MDKPTLYFVSSTQLHDQGRQLTAGEKVPVGSALTLMVGNGAGNMLEDDAADTSMDTEEPVASDASPAQEDSWF